MIKRYSLHKIYDQEKLSFSDIEYSKFKFGDGLIAEKFGRELAHNFIQNELSNHYDGKQLVVVSSPYSFIPTATFYMKNYFVFELNKWLAANSFSVVQETKIHRSTSYHDDYGALDEDQRMSLIGNDSFYLDKDFVADKVIIFLDDIRITGSHERVITKMISTLNLENNYYLLYFAELVNNLIHPKIENHLNFAFVKSLFDLNEIIDENKFVINTRIVKYILNSNHETFRIFIDDKDDEFKELILNMAIGNAYHLIDAYKSNFLYLKEILLPTKLKIINNGN